MVTVVIAIMATVVTIAIVIFPFRTWLDDVARQGQIDEDLYGSVIVQHSRIEDAGIEKSSIRDASGFADFERVCGLFAGEVARIERLRGNAEPSLSSEQGLTRRHAPALGIGSV